MKMKVLFLLVLIIFILSGCSFDVYKESKYGEMAVNSWFSEETLGEVRRKSENINEIINTECEFLESNNNKYVFSCKIVYKEQGETVIPLSKYSEIEVVSVFIKDKLNSYDYKVYNSKYKIDDKIWRNDEYLDY